MNSLIHESQDIITELNNANSVFLIFLCLSTKLHAC